MKKLPTGNRALKAACSALLLASCILSVPFVPSYAQGQITVHGKVVSALGGVPVEGVQYRSYQQMAKDDTGVVSKGAFTLRLTPGRESVPFSLRIVEAATDSIAFSVADAIEVESVPMDANVTITRYPHATLADGRLPLASGVWDKTFVAPRSIGDLNSYLAKKLRYPADARESGTQGTVVVRFVVDEAGNVREPKIVRSLGSGCDEEVLRVIGGMPRWRPGQYGGKTVPMICYLPVTFALA